MSQPATPQSTDTTGPAILSAVGSLFAVARVSSGATAVVFSFIRQRELFIQAGHKSMQTYAAAVLGIRTEASFKKLRQAGDTAWAYFPTRCEEVIKALSTGQHTDLMSFPAIPNVSTLTALNGRSLAPPPLLPGLPAPPLPPLPTAFPAPPPTAIKLPPPPPPCLPFGKVPMPPAVQPEVAALSRQIERIEKAMGHVVARAGLWTVHDVAEFLRLEEQAVYVLVSRDGMRVLRVGRLLRFDPKEINEWLRRHRRDDHPVDDCVLQPMVITKNAGWHSPKAAMATTDNGAS